MRKKTRWLALAVTLVLALFVLQAQDAEKMEAWAKAMTPGEPHSTLAEMAGEWRCVVTIWEDPGAEPMEMSGVSIKTMVMGGRFLREELSGEFMNRPFQGFGVTGYDNVTQQFESVWFDNMGTGIHLSTGKSDRDGVRTYRGESPDHDGNLIPVRSVGRTIDADHHTFEAYTTLPTGKETLHMRVEYTRVSG